ncbi:MULTISPECIES: hypothetical protein [unclassified Exiguobacterium]|uniref:hypothetical protein n=1 Tax=unclassified Exiguobacterium TaxID=2644629 RepID=UPI0011AE6ECD|nr:MULTISPECIES: hypothetical protein [unclassified Exiguobacterium]
MQSFLADINRLIIFIMGLTISANVYLFTTKSKMSSSSVLISKQIPVMTLSLFLNITILIITTSLSHLDYLYGEELVLPQANLIIILSLLSLLNIFSFLLFVITLLKFTKSFNLKRMIDKFLDKVNSRITFNKYFILFTSYKLFFSWMRTYLTKFDNHIKFDYPMNDFNTNSWIYGFGKSISLYKINLGLLVPVATDIYNDFQRIKFKKTSPLTKKQLHNMQLDIEILFQKMSYLIDQNSKSNSDTYIKKFNNIISAVYTSIFHRSIGTNKDLDLKRKFSSVLEDHANLIVTTSQKYEYEKFHRKLLISFLNALPLYKEEQDYTISIDDFHYRMKILHPIFFKELYSLVTELIKSENFRIIELLMVNKSFFNAFISSDRLAIEDGAPFNDNLEETFVAVLNHMIEERDTSVISSIMSLLMNISSKRVQSEKTSPLNVSAIFGNTKQDVMSNTPIQINQEIEEVTISDSLQTALLFSIIKSNEIEEYKTAGYITKVLSSYVSYEELIDKLNQIYSSYSKNKAITYSGTIKIRVTSFNTFSFDYCFSKTIVMILAQLHLLDKLDFEEIDKHQIKQSRLSEFNGFNYFIEKLSIKSKEYNMISLDDKNIGKFSKDLSIQIYEREFNDIKTQPEGAEKITQ